MVNFLLDKYAADEIIAEMGSVITGFLQPAEMNSSEHAVELVTKTL